MNEAGEELTMFIVTEEMYNQYFQDGKITLQNSDGTTYDYVAETPSPDKNRYIWAPEATVTFGEGGETVTVPRGTEFGMFGTMEPGNWVYNGVAFTNDTIIQGDIIVTAQ